MNKIVEDKWVTIIGCLLLFSVQFIANMVIVALPSMSSNLHLDFEMENAINLVFLITSVSLMVPLGTYVSKYGIGRYLKISLLLMIFALLLSAFAADINMLMFSRFLQGIATAVINSSMYVIVTLQLPSDKLGSALGIMGSCGYVGLCLSNTVSGFIVYYFGWRTIFIVLIPVYVATLLILVKLDKEWYIDGIEISDHIGSILYVMFMILFLYGITRLDNAINLPIKNKVSGTGDVLRKNILRKLAFNEGLDKEIAYRPKKAAQYGTGIDKILRKRIIKEMDLSEFVN